MSTADHRLATAALNGLRPGFQADGADLDLVGIDGEVALVRLTISDPQCADDCLLPKALLEQVLLVTLKAAVPSIQKVDLTDPREPPAG